MTDIGPLYPSGLPTLFGIAPELALALCLIIPLTAAALLPFAGRWANLRDGISLTAAVILFANVIGIYTAFQADIAFQLTLVEIFPGLRLAFELEPLGLIFLMIASGLWIVATLYSIGYMRGNKETNQTRFFCFFAISIAATMGIALSGTLLTLFAFYEVLTLATYPLVAHKGDEAAKKGARTYLTILIGTSVAFLLLAVLWTYALAGTMDFRPGGILQGNIEGWAATALLFLFVYGIGKAAVMPFHRWLPAAMVAPTPVSALLHAVAVVKAGVFSIVKVVIYIFGVDFLAEVPGEQWIAYIAGFTILCASAIAIQQTNLKRLLAFSTVSQLSYVVLAAAILTPLSEIGAALHIVAHAFGKITLFFAAGAIYTASKKTEVTQLRGIGHRMPITMIAFSIGALSMIGVPPTAGFVSKWYILGDAFQNEFYFAIVVLVLSTVLNAIYFLPIIFRAFFRVEDVPSVKGDHKEAPWPMTVALGTTATLTILFFLFNAPAVELESRILLSASGAAP